VENIVQCLARELYPPDFLRETAATVFLLVDETDPDCRKWVRKTQDGLNIDIELGLLPLAPRSLNDYPYWGEHLKHIKEAFDRAEPRTLREWINDRRFGVRRFNFWVALVALLLTTLFGFIQSITGIIQVA